MIQGSSQGESQVTVRVLVLLASAGGALAQGGPALACSCRPPTSVDEELQGSDAVFEGVVSGVGAPDPGGMVSVRIRVSRAWKGVTSAEALVQTNSLMWGLAFRVGERWLVFANHRPLQAGLCGKNGRLTLSQPDPSQAALKGLGKPAWVGPQ